MQQPIPTSTIPAHGWLMIDATWNHRHWCLILYRDQGGQVVQWSLDQGERFVTIEQDLQVLKNKGYEPSAIISDGRASILKAVRDVFPGVLQQRCLLHLKRQTLLWLTNHPKTRAGQELRALAVDLLMVKTQAEGTLWEKRFVAWEVVFDGVLKERSYMNEARQGRRSWWYTHRRLRRAWRLLRNALANLWVFLRIEGVPRTTNGLEGGVNAPLKDVLRRHRGWSFERQKRMVAWWIFFRNQG